MAHFCEEIGFRLVGDHRHLARLFQPGDEAAQRTSDDHPEREPVANGGNQNAARQKHQQEIALIAFDGGNLALVKAGDELGYGPGKHLVGQGERGIGPLTAQSFGHHREQGATGRVHQFHAANCGIAQQCLHEVGHVGAGPIDRAIALVAEPFQRAAQPGCGIADAHGHRLFAAQQVLFAEPQETSGGKEHKGRHHHCRQLEV